MRENQTEQQKNIPQTVEKAVEIFINENKIDAAIQFLRENPEEVTEFCYRVFETYQKGDTTGLVQISKIIRELL